MAGQRKEFRFKASPNGKVAWHRWFMAHPLTVPLVAEMLEGQCKIHTHVTFDFRATMNQLDMEDRLLGRIQQMMSDIVEPRRF